MTPSDKTLLVTCALPYANGSIHLGHILEHIQADIYVRFQRMLGRKVYFVCADDQHGSPIMLKAQNLGISPEELIAAVEKEHRADLEGFGITYDNYYRTDSPENREICTGMYEKLKERGYVRTRVISQLYDPEKKMFLPDRFVKGTCPKCGAPDQYGDNCEACGATYSPAELVNPYSTVSGAAPVLRESEHYFFDLPAFRDFLEEWTGSGALQAEMSHKLREWFDEGLQQWDISRDAPYFGFLIPGTEDKYFYVWLDAPTGYLASLKNLLDARGEGDIYDLIRKDGDLEMVHFIGKDILYFHSLFWPATLEGCGYKTPAKIFVHGYVTVNGAKMSKSKGTFIKASTYLRHFDRECLRYYYASKMNGRIDDLDFSLDDFVARVNSDIVNKIVNLASRTAGFVTKKFGGRLGAAVAEPALLARFTDARETIKEAYLSREYHRAIREIMNLADLANKYVDDTAPWIVVRDESRRDELLDVCTMALNMYRILITYLSPVLPDLTAKSAAFLNAELAWDSLGTPLLGTEIRPFKALFARIDAKTVAAMIEDSKEDVGAGKKEPPAAPAPAAPAAAGSAPIGIEDFAKVDMRAARVVSCEAVPGSVKLLKFVVDLGGGETRQIFSGIKESYPEPEKLAGRFVIVAANLKPRKMKFGVSEGMILCAGSDGGGVFLLSADPGVAPGDKVS